MADKVPRLTPGVDIRKFKLDPMDGFLLTRIDGKLGPIELARETGLPDFSVTRALEKLEKLGIIQLVVPGAPSPVAPPVEQPKPAKTSAVGFDVSLLAPKYDPAELEEAAEIPVEQKKRVLDLYYRLDDLDHYTLLGVTREADKKTIKRAYFELAALFHPDRYFKKQIGSFKPKIEILFTKITTALDTLTDKEARAEYDAYLAEVATTQGMEAMLERALAESAGRAAEASSTASAAPAPPPAPVPTVSAAPPPPSGPSAAEIQRRKEALARRLTGGGPRLSTPPSRPVETPPSANPLRYASPQDAVDALKRRYLERIDGASQAQATRHIQAAEEALAKNDLAAAATALNIATKFAPDDLALSIRAQEVRANADKVLSESYLKQAQYEERQGHWNEAGRSWQKVAKLRNDPIAHERAAHALLRSTDGDLHEAAEHAKQAITLEPTAVANHVTLVEVYLKAGLIASARRAAETANNIDPTYAPLQALLKKFPKA